MGLRTCCTLAGRWSTPSCTSSTPERSGATCRHDLPDWQLVYHYFDQWKRDGPRKKLNDTLRIKVRKKAGREAEPTASILDSQSVKTTEEARTKSYDAGKKVKGRKRHLLVDTLGLLLLVWMTTENVQDRDAAQAVLPLAAQQYPTLEKTWADGAYAGPQVEAVARESGINVEVVKRSDQNKGFVVQAWGWIVERTFGSLNVSGACPRTTSARRSPPRLSSIWA